MHGQGEPGSALPFLPTALPEDAADSSRAGWECSGLQSEVIDNSSDGELGSEDLHDSVGNGPETFQWDIDAQGWDFSSHQRRCAGANPLSAKWTWLSYRGEKIHATDGPYPALRHGAGSSRIYMRGGDNFSLKHRQTLREALTAGSEASLVTVSEAERDSLGITGQSAVTQRLFALIPIAQGIRLTDIRARDLGSLASPYGTNNGTYALRSESYSDGLARRCYTMVQGRQTDGSPVMVKLYFNNRATREERSRFRFDSQEEKECRARELSVLGQKHDMGDSCEDSSEEEEQGLRVQSFDDGEPRAMKTDIYTFGCKAETANAGGKTANDSEDSMPSLVDDERQQAEPYELLPAGMPPLAQVFGYNDGALRFATTRFGHRESGVSLAVMRSVRGGVESD